MARWKQLYNSFTEQNISLELEAPGFYHAVFECFDENFTFRLQDVVEITRKEMELEVWVHKQRVCYLYPEQCPKRLEVMFDTVNKWFILGNPETQNAIYRTDWSSTQDSRYWIHLDAPDQPFGFKLYKDVPMADWQHKSMAEDLKPQPRQKFVAKKHSLEG